MNNTNINVLNPVLVRSLGMQALVNSLGPVGMVKFLQQFDTGKGDYTKEKYELEEESFEELDKQLQVFE